eukprot:GHRQ01015635.1.p1 GENE.GHRQ01015635.1~~GHRQ01015635.1.p1  ORF type:complete len:173 (-),score=31.59 GHRQ01015635.1:171-689(-)
MGTSYAALLPASLLRCLQEILDVEQVTEESQGLSLTSENVDQVGRGELGALPLNSRARESASVHCQGLVACMLWQSRPQGYQVEFLLIAWTLTRALAALCTAVMFVCCQQVLGEIRPYLVGTGGGELILDSIDGVIVKVKITGPAANVMTVRVAVTQKLREKIPTIAAVQLL